jgi:hypothetical protein
MRPYEGDTAIFFGVEIPRSSLRGRPDEVRREKSPGIQGTSEASRFSATTFAPRTVDCTRGDLSIAQSSVATGVPTKNASSLEQGVCEALRGFTRIENLVKLVLSS